MMRRISLFSLFFPLSLSAQEFYEITASSLFSEKNSGGDVQSLNLKELESTQDSFAQSQLERLPALNMTPMGPEGRTVEYTMRGAKAPQNAVFLDGVPLNDPASGGKFDFADFLSDDLEEIEVLPGANSVIYGADALGGVIHLKTKKGRGKPRGLAKGSAGNFNTRQGHVEAQGEFHNLNFYAGGTGYKSGRGTFKNKVYNTTQSDDYRNSTVSSSLGMTPNDNTEIWAFVRQIDANVKFDDPQFVGSENAYLPMAEDAFTHTRTVVGGLHGDVNTFDNFWEHHVILGTARTKRESNMPGFSMMSQGSDGRLKYYQDFHWTSWTTSTVGTEWGHEKAEDSFTGKHTRNRHAFFFQEKFKPLKSTELTSGIRYDHYSFGGERMNYRFGASHKLENTRLRSSFGTGFKPPVLSDLFNSGPFAVPNPSLKAETNKSFDVGCDYKLNEQLEVSLTGFINHIKNVVISQKVGPDFKYQRVNAGERSVRGLEGALTYTPLLPLKFRTTATLTKAYDKHLGKRAPLIPTFKGTFEVFWKPTKTIELFTTANYRGSQTDSIAPKTLKPFVNLNVGGKYNFYKQVSLFGRVENLNGKRYEEVFGYGVRGRTFLIGLEVQS